MWIRFGRWKWKLWNDVKGRNGSFISTKLSKLSTFIYSKGVWEFFKSGLQAQPTYVKRIIQNWNYNKMIQQNWCKIIEKKHTPFWRNELQSQSVFQSPVLLRTDASKLFPYQRIQYSRSKASHRLGYFLLVKKKKKITPHDKPRED